MHYLHKVLVCGVSLSILISISLIFFPDEFCFSQQFVLPDQPPTILELDAVTLPTNRTDSLGVRRVRESLSKGEYSQTIRFLDEILNRSEDSFLLLDDQGKYVGLKETALEIIKTLPVEGRQIYETTYEPVANRLLRQAMDEGDIEKLRLVTSRYFYTPSGYEAAFLLAELEADMGRFHSAALTYQQLLDTPNAARKFNPQLTVQAALSWLAAGYEEQSRQLLSQLKEDKFPSIQIGTEELLRKGDTEYALVKLSQGIEPKNNQQFNPKHQWLTRYGNPQRNGQPDGGLPHMRADWQVRLLSHPVLESAHDVLASDRVSQNKTLIPAATPLAVGNYLITRTAHHLVAIDFKTGKRVWRTQPQRFAAAERLINGTEENDRNNGVDPAQGFAQRIWDDYLYNSISSDGQRIYVIRDLKTPTVSRYDLFAAPFIQPGRTEAYKAGANRLCAYDLKTQGKLVWEFDGAGPHESLDGVFFLGTPITVGQTLYCMAEVNDEKTIYLLALDSETGKLQWHQQLVNLETGVIVDVARRLQATMVSYDDGMLVCPTGVGVVVGVDLAKKTLAWSYQYEPLPPANPFSNRPQNRNTNNKDRWLNSPAIISNGHVLLTPHDSKSIHCVQLATGDLVWKLPKEQSQFLAGVDGSTVLLAGRHKLSAVQLEDGKSAWETPAVDYPDKSHPTGFGFLSDGKYFMPMSNAEVIAFDVKQGTLVKRAIAKDGIPLGNLICHQGTVISQTGGFLNRFGQIDVLLEESQQRLTVNPEDHVALRTLGEIAFNEDRLNDAIQLLSKAYEKEPGSRQTRDILSECLQAALDKNFPEYQNQLSLLEEIQGPAAVDQLTLMRLKAKGMTELGEVLTAFSICQEMVDLSKHSYQMLEIGRSHQVALPRWIRAQMASIWEMASLEHRNAMSESLLAEIGPLLQHGNLDQLDDFANFYQSLEICEPLVLELAKRHLDQGNKLAAQQLIASLTDSQVKSICAEATARSAQLLHEADLGNLAFDFESQLQDTFADTECFDGKTGAEYLDEWSKDSIQPALDWPYGLVEVKTHPASKKTNKRGNRPSYVEVQLEHSDGVLADCNVFLGHNSELLVRDSVGNEIFRATLDQPRGIPIYNFGAAYAVASGNLLILSLGDQFFAFDTLNASRAEVNKPLWKKKAISQLDSRLNQIGRHRMRSAARPGSHRAPRAQRDGKWVGVIGPVTKDSCVIQEQTRLVCLDPLSGETKWIRKDVPAGSDLFGDEKYVFVVDPKAEEAKVFSVTDGSYLGTRYVPVWRERLTTIGTHVIRWFKKSSLEYELCSKEAFSQEVSWRYKFDKTSHIDIAKNRFASIVDANGRCVVLDLLSGEKLVDTQVRPSTGIRELHFFAGKDHFVVSVQLPSTARNTRRRISLMSADFTLFDGHVYVFKRSDGKPTYAGPATMERQGLLLAQPVDLPVIAFAANLPRQTNKGGGNYMCLTLLEKASGRVLYSNDRLPMSPHQFALYEDKEKTNEMLVEMINQQIRLSFTDKPRPPEPAAVQEIDSPGESTRKGLLGIAEKMIEGS